MRADAETPPDAAPPSGIAGLLARPQCYSLIDRLRPECDTTLIEPRAPDQDWILVDLSAFEKRFGKVEGVEARHRRMLAMRPGSRAANLPNSLPVVSGLSAPAMGAEGDRSDGLWGCVSEECFLSKKRYD